MTAAPKVKEWTRAYLAQARADFRAAQEVSAVSPSTFLMLMQMVYEKTGKAILLMGGQKKPADCERSHAAIGAVLTIIKRDRKLRDFFYRYGMRQVETDIRYLERLHPQIAKPAGGERLEYPWEDPVKGDVRWPERDLGIARRINPADLTARRLLEFANVLMDRYDILA